MHDDGGDMTANYPDGPAVGSSGGSVGGDGSSTKEQVKEQARQAAGTAAEASRHVAGVASGEAAKVASEARSQVAGLVSQASSQVQSQSREQLGRLAELVGSLADELEEMGSQGSGPAAGVVSEVASRARGLSSSLQGREPGEVLEDVRRFARRRPGVFLVGSLAAGVLAGRLTRGAKAAQDDSSGATYSSPSPGYAAPAGPVTGSVPAYSGTPAAVGYAGTGTTADPYDASLPTPASSVVGDASYTGTSQVGRP
jgi:gas vesicle protein